MYGKQERNIWTKNRLEELLKNIKGDFFFSAPLKKFTSLHMGGIADALVIPKDINDLRKIVEISNSLGIPREIIGFGTNLLISDNGVRGIVICMRNAFSNVEVSGETISASAGSTLKEVMNISQKHLLTGLEFVVGIPGSIGGAVVMNAGAYKCELKDLLSSVTLMNSEGELEEIGRKNLQFSYRKTLLPKDSIVVGATFKLKTGEKEKIEELISLNLQKRKKSQPGGYSAGSVFKNPPQNFAGKLIEECGLKGYKIGGVAVSVKHANFFVNDGTGTASQMEELICFVKSRVKEKTGITLEEEVRMVGIFKNKGL